MRNRLIRKSVVKQIVSENKLELGRRAALQLAAGEGVLVQGEQTSDITQVSEDHIA